MDVINPLNAELNPICHLLALLGVHFLHVSRIRVKLLTLRLLMSYIYIYDISSLRVKLPEDGTLVPKQVAIGFWHCVFCDLCVFVFDLVQLVG